MRGTTRAAALVLAALLATTACGAPLRPQSQRSEPTDTPGAEPTPAAPAAPSSTAPPAPEVTVPEGIESVAPLTGPLLGGDVSWPQCPTGMGIPQRPTLGLPMPTADATYVVIGLTNGPGFTPNPCVGEQLAWVRERQLLVSAYSVLSHPHGDQLARHGQTGPYDGSNRLGAMRNVGHAQARYNIATMERVGLRTPMVWLDVEQVPAFDWSSDQAANAAVVEGAARGYTDAGYRIGVYSTAYIWGEIVGDLRLGIPEWRAAGETSREEAVRRCGPDRQIQGGSPVMSQWLSDDRDWNITCPGTAGRMLDWFAQT